MTREARIQEALQQTTELQEWLLRAGVVAKQLNLESPGDLAAPTVAGAPSGLSRCASQAKPLIDYRKEGEQ